MAGAGARTGRQDPVRWRPHPKGRHRICRNLCRGSRPGSASPPGLRAIERRAPGLVRSEEHTSEIQSHGYLVCRLLLEKKNVLRLRYRWNRLILLKIKQLLSV